MNFIQKFQINNPTQIRDWLTLCAAILMLIGGFIQIWALILVDGDIAYLKFFSNTQLFVDGLFGIFILVYIGLVYKIIIYLFGNKKWFKELPNKDISIIFLIIIFILYIIFSFLLFAIYPSFYLFIFSFYAFITFIIAMIIENEKSNIKLFALVVFFIMFPQLLDPIYQQQYQKLSTTVGNYQKLAEKVSTKYHLNENDKLELRYFNQEYIFLRVTKDKNKIIVIEKFSELFDNSENDKK